MSEHDSKHEQASSGGHGGGGHAHRHPPGGGGGGGHEEGGGESAPLWVISFADLSTLLMSFFVLMMASTPKGQTSDANPNAEILKVLASVKVAFDYRPKPGSNDPLDLEVLKLVSQQHGGGRGESEKPKDPTSDAGEGGTGKYWKAPGIKGTSSELKQLWNKTHSVVGEAITFARRSSELDEAARTRIAEIADNVRSHYRILVLRGHVSYDEAAEEGNDGFSLSYLRALALKRELEYHGIHATRIRIIATGPYEPIETLDESEDGVAQNRRGEVTLGTQFLPNTSMYYKPKDQAGSEGGGSH